MNLILKTFTFHYGSIETKELDYDSGVLDNLHSTMALLKQDTPPRKSFETQLFTFHYGSIETEVQLKVKFCGADLHSTMALLKLLSP